MESCHGSTRQYVEGLLRSVSHLPEFWQILCCLLQFNSCCWIFHFYYVIVFSCESYRPQRNFSCSSNGCHLKSSSQQVLVDQLMRKAQCFNMHCTLSSRVPVGTSHSYCIYTVRLFDVRKNRRPQHYAHVTLAFVNVFTIHALSRFCMSGW